MLRNLAFIFLLIFTLSTLAFADSIPPDQVVASLVEDLSKTLDARRTELQANREELLKTIDHLLLPHFDIDYASILVLGQYAPKALPEQRVRFAKAFYNSLAHRYAEGLLKYTEGRVKVLAFRGELNDKRSIVQTRVALDDGKNAAVDYAFRKTKNGEWKAYDVIIEGISYISNYRNQVAAEIQKTSLDALIARLETQGEKALEALDQGTGKKE